MQRRVESGASGRHVDLHAEPLRIPLRQFVDAGATQHPHLGTRLLDRRSRLEPRNQGKLARDRIASGTAESEIQTSGR